MKMDYYMISLVFFLFIYSFVIYDMFQGLEFCFSEIKLQNFPLSVCNLFFETTTEMIGKAVSAVL